MTLDILRFTSASGIKVDGKYKNVETKRKHNIAKYQFVGVDGAYYQDTSLDVLEIPTKIILSSRDNNTLVANWRSALEDLGVGVLEHPDPDIGIVDVVVSQFDIDTSAVQNGYTTLNITFYKNINTNTNTRAQTLDNVIDNMILDISNSMGLIVDTTSAISKNATENAIISTIDGVVDGIKSIASVSSLLQSEIKTTTAKIKSTVSELSQSPTLIAGVFNSLYDDIFNNLQIETQEIYTETSDMMYNKFTNTLFSFSNLYKNQAAVFICSSFIYAAEYIKLKSTSPYDNKIDIINAIDNIVDTGNTTIERYSAIINKYENVAEDKKLYIDVTSFVSVISRAKEDIIEKLSTASGTTTITTTKKIHPIVAYIEYNGSFDIDDYIKWVRNNELSEVLYGVEKNKKLKFTHRQRA